VTDRHLFSRLPDVELADLPGPIARSLERPRRRRKQRPHRAQIVVDDSLARGAAKRLKQLPDQLPGQLGVLAEQPVDLRLIRVELGALRRPPVDRRLVALITRADTCRVVDPEGIPLSSRPTSVVGVADRPDPRHDVMVVDDLGEVIARIRRIKLVVATPD